MNIHAASLRAWAERMDLYSSRIESVGELVEHARGASAERGVTWYRGQTNADWNLQPKVLRNAKIQGNLDYGYETNLAHRFRGRAPHLGATMDTEKNAAWLQTMQHHKLPTRLLDWSRSPLVAAYFAIEEAILHPDVAQPDAVIWCLNPHELNWRMTTPQDSITPSIESGLARSLVDGAFYGDESAKQSATARRWRWKSDEASSVGKTFDPLTDDYVHPSLLAVMASESDVRMVVQQGAFTLHEFGSTEMNLLDSASNYLQKLVIPARAILRFAAQVEACGFGEAGIYPDLDHLSGELERRERGVGAR